ncbi:MAG: hypothetical protein LBK58_03725 [Prevotellaceae bacterium]|nr:hypothetical protein [Prevotellaceae bacterium]
MKIIFPVRWICVVNAARRGLVLLALLLAGVPLMKAEIRWNTVAKQSLTERTRDVWLEYDKLYKYPGKNGLFLYNHAAELHEVKEYEKSLSAFEQCIRYCNDMDVRMLYADNHKGNVPASENRTDVKPFNKMQSGQGNLLENETPKGLLPP